MMDKANWLFKNLHLLTSISIVVPTAIVYGSPAILPKCIDIQANTTDLLNMLKSIMCLYLGIAGVWILGVWNAKYWKTATQLNALFMLTLATGRAMGMATDGLPTAGYIFGIMAEIVLGVFSIIQLRRYGSGAEQG